MYKKECAMEAVIQNVLSIETKCVFEDTKKRRTSQSEEEGRGIKEKHFSLSLYHPRLHRKLHEEDTSLPSTHRVVPVNSRRT